jgi:hypothetical protein
LARALGKDFSRGRAEEPTGNLESTKELERTDLLTE